MSMKTICRLMACWLLLYASPVLAEGDTSTAKEAKELLQKGLTIYEIDREVERLVEQDKTIADQIQGTGVEIARQDKNVQASRKHAGDVLRAYYTGDRDSIWLLLFSVRSFADVLHTFEYLNMIVQNDHRALTNFTASLQQLKALQTKLEASRIELERTKDNYLKQRTRLIELQAELDKQLAISTQAQAVQVQIKSLKDEWEQKGLPLFRNFFEQLSLAFFDLPQLLMKDIGKNLKIDGNNGAIYTLTDQDFNSFLQVKNELFNNLNFRFSEGKVFITGKRDDAQIDIQGNFSLIENIEANEVRFTIEQLVFNGYNLPDTTISSLQEEFPLGFYPKKGEVPVEVTTVTNEEGKIIIRLKF
jgi:hypothetical protein